MNAVRSALLVYLRAWRYDLKSGMVGLNITHLALNLSRHVNGVAKRHGEVSRFMFAGYEIDTIQTRESEAKQPSAATHDIPLATCPRAV